MIIESHIPRTYYPYSILKICVSVQSMSHLTPARSQDLHLTSPSRSCLNPGPYVCISPPFWLLPTSIQVHKVASQLHPSTISNQSNFQDVHLTSFQICKIASEVHPASISNSYWFKMYVSTPSGPVSPESRFQDTCITSFHVPFDLNPGPKIHIPPLHPGVDIRVSPPARPCLTSIHLWKSVAHFHTGSLSISSRFGDVMFPSLYVLISIQAP